MGEPSTKGTKERLLQCGAELFAEKGFGGVSVRTICARADTSMNMIHHYFGSKEGLLDAIVDRASTSTFVVPMRLFRETPRSKQEFESILELVFETTLEAFIEQRAFVMVVLREQSGHENMQEYSRLFADFLERSKRKGFVRKALDCEMITGAILDRIVSQVQYAPWLNRVYGVDVLTDVKFRRRWCKSNVGLFLYGLVED